MNILFLCTGNSCRSVLGEAIFNHLAPADWHAMSAGSRPTGQVHPYSLKVLQSKGLLTEGLFSKSWDDLPVMPDIVITVCSSAAHETCPLYLGQAIRAHWGLDDPAGATGSEEEVLKVFEQTFEILSKGINVFFQLPLSEIQHQPELLKQKLDFIGQHYFN